MTRVKRGKTAKFKHKKILSQAKGFYGARSRTFKVAKQAVIKSKQYSFRDRRVKKRTMRRLWIVNINIALRKVDISYSKFINLLTKSEYTFNRKILFDILNNDKNLFYSIVNKIKGKNGQDL